MKRYFVALGACCLVATVALAAVPPERIIDPARSTGEPAGLAAGSKQANGAVHLFAFGSRSVQQRESVTGRKLDAVLADLATHASLARPGHELNDLHSLSPAVRFKMSAVDSTPLVLVDVVTTGDPQKLRTALLGLGMQQASLYSNDVGGWLPLRQLEAATARAEVHSIRAAMSRTRAGAVMSQGDFAQRSDMIRSTYASLTGAGVTVGVISDSFNCYAYYAKNGVPASGPAGYASNGFLADAAKDASTGDLPASVQLVSTPSPVSGQPAISGEADCKNYGAPTQLPFTDEGRAMLQIVHDVAPGASLSFHTAENGEADFAQGIKSLAAAGATVIADDVGYFDEPFFQDGLVAQAIDAVKAQGVAYFSAAGNNGQFAWESAAPGFSTVSADPHTAGEHLLNFDTTGATTSTALPVSIPALSQGEVVAIVLQWDQPYVTGAPNSGGATSQLNLCVSGSGADKITDINGNAVTCTGLNALGQDPFQVMILSNPANAPSATPAENVNVVVGLGAASSPPGRVKVAIDAGGAPVQIQKFSTFSPTLQGHPGAAGAAALGAAFFYNTPPCGVSPARLDSYSSRGGTPILFNSAGTRLAAPVTRQKPDFVGPDGVNNTFLGFTIPAGTDRSSVAQCANIATYPNFYGTSAATPHAAAAAALMLQANSAITPDQIYTAFRNSASAMTEGPDAAGAGFIQADAALKQLPPAAPTLSLAATTVAAGSMTTLTWSSVNTTGCTASGSWSGNQPTSGSQTITAPTTAGTATYTLTCSNAVSSASSKIDLIVTGSSGSGYGGGGGSLDELTLLVLATLGIGRCMARGATLRIGRFRDLDGHVGQ